MAGELRMANASPRRSATQDTIPLLAQESPIHGLGCFALRDIPEGSTISEYTGEVIDLAEAIRRNDESSADYSELIIEVDDEHFLDGARAGNVSIFINHSCEANCYIEIIKGRPFFVALRTISAGEEVTLDYDYDAGLRESCSCGSVDCRGHM